MLLAVIGGVVAGVAVTFITAVGSLSENLILQDILFRDGYDVTLHYLADTDTKHQQRL